MSQYLCKIADIDANGKKVRVCTDSGTTYIMLFQQAGTVRAFLNVCPHQAQHAGLVFLEERDDLFAGKSLSPHVETFQGSNQIVEKFLTGNGPVYGQRSF